MLAVVSVSEQRLLAVREALDAGASVTDVPVRHGVDRRTVHRWLVRYADEGLLGWSRRVRNGWADPEPAWWLNLQAHLQATVDLAHGRREVRGRAAEGEERSRLWSRWREIDKNLDAYAAHRSGETAIVIPESSSDPDK